MTTHRIQTTWTPEGDKIEENIYNVYPFPCINGTPALSVYGGKMVQNWLQFNSELLKEKSDLKEIEDAGFNYTGL